MLNLISRKFKPGDVVSIDCGFYVHVGIISTSWSLPWGPADGRPRAL